MTGSRLGWVAREGGDFLRLVLLWFGLGSVVLLFCWWTFSVTVGIALTSPTLWRACRDRVLLRPRS